MTGYNRPWWRAGRRCRGDGGVPIVLAAAYDRPGWGTRVGDGKDCSGSRYDRPGGRSLFRSSASRGVSTIVVFFAVLFWTFVWPRRRMQLRGGIGCGARVDMVSGFVCVVVVMVSDAEHGGMWWSTGCYVALFRLKWWPGL